MCQNPAVVERVTNQTLVQIPALRSIPNGHSFLSFTEDLFKCLQMTGRNSIIFPFSVSKTSPWSLWHLCRHLTHNLITATFQVETPGRLTSLQSNTHTEHGRHQPKNLHRLLKDKIKPPTPEFFLPGSNSALLSAASQSVTYSIIPISNTTSTTLPHSFSSPSPVLFKSHFLIALLTSALTNLFPS